MMPEIFDANPMYVHFGETFSVVMNRSITPDSALIAELEQSSYDVFHVSDARDSEYIPDQEHFVLRLDACYGS